MATHDEILKALQSLQTLNNAQKGKTVTQKQGVMTDVGPGNARAYSAILSGQTEPAPGPARLCRDPGLGFSNIFPSPPPAGSAPGTSPLSVTADSPLSIFESMTAGAHHAPEAAEPKYPQNLLDMSDDELRGLINVLNGVKAGKKGSVRKRTKRDELLAMAAKAMGVGRRTQPVPAGALASESHTAASGASGLPGFDSILAGMPGMSAEGIMAGTGPANLPDVSVPGYTQPTTPAMPLGASLTSQAMAAGGSSTGSGSYLARGPQRGVSSTHMLPQAGLPGIQGVQSNLASAGSGPQQAYSSILAGQQAPQVSSHQTLTGGIAAPSIAAPSVAPGRPSQPAPVMAESANLPLIDALKRLTGAVQEASKGGRTVAQDTEGMSWQQRMERLRNSGRLLTEDQVRSSTLRKSVSQRDVVTESERAEQQQRTEDRDRRKKEVWHAGGDLAQSIGNTVRGGASRLFGGRIGGAMGRGTERMAGSVIGSVLGRAGIAGVAGGLGGAAGGGAAAGAAGAGGLAAGGAALAGLAVNPATIAIATGVAMVKLPGIVERFGTSLNESQRRLAQYNGALAGMYARLDYQKRQIDRDMARNTSGSATMLGGELGKLREELQPLREMNGTLKNLLMALATQGARATNFLMHLDPRLQGLLWIAEKLERALGQSNAGNTAIVHSMQIMAGYKSAGNPPGPRNRRPPAARGAQDSGDPDT